MTCADCQAANPAGSMFCVACARPLAAGAPGLAPVIAAPAVLAAPAPAHVPSPAPAAGPSFNVPSVPPAIKLVELENLQPTGRVLPLPGRDWAGTLFLGRPDLANGVVVDLDLAALDGHAKRVSRRQAKLHYVTQAAGGPNEVRVEDWASAHGTWLNKARLPAGVSEPLAPGDEVRFAELVFRVELA